jgi:chitosanase
MAFGPWGNEASASTTFKGAWISNPSNHPETLIILPYGGVGRTHSKDRAKTALQFVGRTYPVYDLGEARAESLNVSTTLPGDDEGTPVTIRRLRDMVGDSQVVLFRDGRGRKMYAMPTDFTTTDIEMGGYEVSFLLNRVDFSEAVPEVVEVPVEGGTNQVQNFQTTVDIASSSVLVDWDDVPGAGLYTVYLDGVPVIQTETSLASYGPLVPGSYSMWARATVNGVEGPPSTTQGFIIEEQDPTGGDGETGGGTTTPPPASNVPTLTAFPQANKSVNFTVTPVTGATGYKLYEIRSPNGVTNGTYTATSFTRGSPTPLADGPFDYWVTALGPWGESAISNHQQFTLPYDGSPIGGGGGGTGGTVGADSIYRTTFEEFAYELTSLAENSRKDWYHTDVYGYIEDIGDNRGYTAGIVGFCSGTGDMLAMIQHYVAIKPTSNAMQTYVDELTTLASEGINSSAGTRANSLLGTTFKSLWANLAVNDPLFRQAQRDYREDHYFRPAFNQAVADNVGPLGLAILYDISVNHGEGSDSESFGGIVATARAASAPPSLGGTEAGYLQALINARSAVLTAWGDNPSNGRVAMHNALKTAGKYLLQIPPTLSVSMYGDPFSFTSRPELPAEAARPGNVQPGTPGSGGTGGGGALPTPVVALGLGTGDGQLHYNLGMGFVSGHVNITPTELYAWSGTNITKLTNEGWVFTKLDSAGNIVVSLEAPRDGGTTSSNTDYARCEFREQDEDGDGNISFNPTSGMHYQEGYSRIVSLTPLKPGVCVNQGHDAGGDVMMIKTKKSGTKIVVVIDILGTEAAVIDTDYKVGELIWSRLEINNSVMKVFYTKGGQKTTTPVFTRDVTGLVTTSGWYWKFGNYLQSNEITDTTGRIIVEVHGWKHWHTGWPTPLDPSGAAPTVNAGSDATVAPGATFSRTGTSTGTGITAQGWRLVGAGTANDPGTAAFTQNWGSPQSVGDEFNYTGTPDPAKWSLYDGPGHDNNGLRVPARCTVAGGKLSITGLAGSPNAGGMAHKYDRQYGKWEIRARSFYTSAPTNQGGLTPSYHPVAIIWPTNDLWPQGGEYDFMENDRVGQAAAGAFIHYPSKSSTNYQEAPSDFPVDMRQFNNFAIEWTSSFIKLYVNGTLWATFSGGSDANKNAIQAMLSGHLTLQMDAFTGSGMNAGTMEVEWVRVYPVTPVTSNPTLSTTSALSWTAPSTPGTYTLEYFATNSQGTSTDQVVVTVSGTGSGTSNLVYPETFDDGTPYSLFGPGQTVISVSGSTALASALSAASPGHIITLQAGTYTGDFQITGKTGTATSGIVIRSATTLGAVFTSGSSFTINNCSHVTVEGLDFPFDQEGDTLLLRGNSTNCRYTRNRVGPASFTNAATAGNYIFVGDDARHFRIDHNTLRNKGTSGNVIRVYGNFDTFVGCKYGRIDHNLIDTVGDEVGNDKECIRYGVSTMSRTDAMAVIERNVIVNAKAEPEVISGKMGRVVQRGNVILRCAGGIVIRHGRNCKQQSNYVVDRVTTTATAGLKSGGSRFYDSGHLIEDNYYDGVAGTSGFQRAIILDTGDVNGTSTNLAGHWQVIAATVQRNVIVNSVSGIYVGDNYALAPQNCGILNNDVINSGGVVITTLEPMIGDSVTTGNTYYATTTAGGYTADSAGIFRKSGRGPKVSYLATTDVGHAGDLTDADRTGVAV